LEDRKKLLELSERLRRGVGDLARLTTAVQRPAAPVARTEIPEIPSDWTIRKLVTVIQDTYSATNRTLNVDFQLPPYFVGQPAEIELMLRHLSAAPFQRSPVSTVELVLESPSGVETVFPKAEFASRIQKRSQQKTIIPLNKESGKLKLVLFSQQSVISATVVVKM
jgi:hypothetical protein